MAYKDIVREMFKKHKGKMAAKEIMKLAAAEHRKRGGGVSAGALTHSKSVKGGGVIGKTLGTVSSLADVFGLGLEKKPKAKKSVKGGGVIGKTLGTVSSIADVFGLGLEKKKRGRKPKSAVSGGGVGLDFLASLPHPPPRGGRFGMPALISSRGAGFSGGSMADVASNVRKASMGTTQPFQPQLNPSGGDLVQTAATLLPLLALL